jgi:hypothetical protein
VLLSPQNSDSVSDSSHSVSDSSNTGNLSMRRTGISTRVRKGGEQRRPVRMRSAYTDHLRKPEPGISTGIDRYHRHCQQNHQQNHQQRKHPEVAHLRDFREFGSALALFTRSTSIGDERAAASTSTAAETRIGALEASSIDCAELVLEDTGNREHEHRASRSTTTVGVGVERWHKRGVASSSVLFADSYSYSRVSDRTAPRPCLGSTPPPTAATPPPTAATPASTAATHTPTAAASVSPFQPGRFEVTQKPEVDDDVTF